jgi:hypothetical protein
MQGSGRSSVDVPKMFGTKLIIYNSAIPHLVTCGEKLKTFCKHYSKMFICALFIIIKGKTSTKCPLTDKWTKSQYIYTVKYYSAII